MSLWNFLSNKRQNTESESRRDGNANETFEKENSDENFDNADLHPEEQGAAGDTPQSEDDTCTERCPQHEKEIVQYFCPTHKTLGCSVCIMIDHRNCEGVVYIPKVAGEVPESDEFKEFEKTLNHLKEMSEGIVSTSKENIPKVLDNFKETMQAIENVKKEKIDKVIKLENSLKTEAAKRKTENTERMEDLHNKATTTKDQVFQIVCDMEAFMKQRQFCKLYVEMKRMKDQLSTLHENLEKLERENFIRTYKVIPGKRKMDINESLEEEGGPSTSDHGINSDSMQQSKRMKLSNDANCISDQRAEYLTEIFIKSETDKQIVCHVEGMVALSGNRLVITDKRNCKVKLVDTLQAKIVSELDVPSVPYGMTRMSDNKVAVALKCEHAPRCDRMLVLKVERKLQAERLVPTQIMFDGNINYRKNKFLVIKDNGCQIQEINMVGESRTVDLCGQIFGTFAATASSQNRDCIHVITIEHHEGCDEGYVLKKTTLDEELNNQNQTVQNIVYSDAFHIQHRADQTGRVYILSSGTIQIMDQERSEPRILLTTHDGIYRPSSVCFDQETNKLYVGMSDNNNIRVFKLS